MNTDTKYRPYLTLTELDIISKSLESVAVSLTSNHSNHSNHSAIDIDIDVINSALRQIGKTILNAKANSVPAYTSSLRAGTTKHSISKLELTPEELQEEELKLMQSLTSTTSTSTSTIESLK